jgi:hypothetical protein
LIGSDVYDLIVDNLFEPYSRKTVTERGRREQERRNQER